MNSVVDRARVVIIGAGIAGNSLAYHLGKLGWREIVQVDKGRLPNPGGSTGHASNMIILPEGTEELTALGADSIAQYVELGVFTRCGGIEVSRTRARTEDFKRRRGIAKSWSVEADLIPPSQVKELVPFIDETRILSGLYMPEMGVVDAVRAGTIMRDRAVEMGALTVAHLTEVIGIGVENGRVASVQTSNGEIRTETVVVCCGVWSPRIAKMAGATIPLTPAVHQLISVGPVAAFADLPGEINFPMIRDMDHGVYERQHGADMEVGSNSHRPILVDPDDIPSVDKAVLSPTELPFTSEDFDAQMGYALELMPSIFGDEQAGVRYAINGLLSLTADGLPIIGELPEVRGLWSANLVWTKTGAGIGRALAELMTSGQSEVNLQPFDAARFHNHERSIVHVRARAAEWFNKYYGIVHPAEESISDRSARLSPIHDRERALGAVFREEAGWEIPNWYEANRPLLADYGDRVMPRDDEWDGRWWSPIINAEHLAMRDRVGLADLSALSIFEVSGPGAVAFLQHLAVSQIDVPLGRIVYTWLLNPAGGVLSDLTITRVAVDRFLVMEGDVRGMRDKKWMIDHLPSDGSVQLQDVTSSWCSVGVWGPRARDLVQSISANDLSDAACPFLSTRTVDVGGVRSLMSRISYVGELGWEIRAPSEEGVRLWDGLWDAGQALGVVAVGDGVCSATGRLEKSFRAHGTELSPGYDLVEAGLARPTVKDADFVGRAAYMDRRSRAPISKLCTLVVDEHRSSTGVKRYMLGGEPILTLDGRPLVDAKGRRSYVTSAGSGPSLGRHLLMSYLPTSVAEIGTNLLVEYFGETYPVGVVVVGCAPLYDPGNSRLRS